MSEYDLAIIGKGAAAFSAAIKISELTSNQIKIAMIGYGPIGGTCVNVGCVPSKYLIEASKNFEMAKKPLYDGIKADASIDFDKFMESLNGFVSDERKEKYEKVIKNFDNIDLYDGKAKFLDKNTVAVNNDRITAFNFLIATGSKTFIPDIKGLTDYYTSENIWNIRKIPEKLVILGSGEVAIELAYAFSNFGSEVHIFNRSDRILKGFDEDITDNLRKIMENHGIKFHTGVNINEIKSKTLSYGNNSVNFDEIIVATGRIPNIDDLDLNKAGIKFNNRGIIVDKYFKTSNENIYAAGDCVDQELKLETLAGKEGAVSAENIFGSEKTVNIKNVPWVVFCDPNVASVGYTEKELKSMNIKYNIRKIDLKNVVKANILKSNDGIAKVISDENGTIIGVQVLAPNAAEFIIEGVYLIQNKLTYNDIINSSHVFPTVAESIKIAGQSFIRDISKMSCCME